MTYEFKFNNLTEEQENKFNEVIKAIPYDVVSELKDWAEVMDVNFEVIERRYITTVVMGGY